MKVLLVAPLNPHTGYGNDGIAMCEALLDAGVDLFVDPTHVSGPLPPRVALLLTKRLEAPFDVLLHHVDPGQLGLRPAQRRACAVAVAWTMWEFTTLNNLRGRSKLRKALVDYDLVVGYDAVSTAALAPYVTTQAATVQGGFDPGRWPHVSRDFHSQRFSFCMAGALHERKNPFVAIEAFRQLRDEDPLLMGPVELHLKTVNVGLHTKMQNWLPGLKIHYEVWNEDRMRDFYRSQHVMLAPSRGEGKNMPALEFQSTGAPVAATNWGGHSAWMGADWSFDIGYELKPVPGAKDCMWAEADVESLKSVMRFCVTNRDEVARRGRMAADVIPRMCSWDTVLDRLFMHVGETGGDRGAWLRHEWFQAKDDRRGVREVIRAG